MNLAGAAVVYSQDSTLDKGAPMRRILAAGLVGLLVTATPVLAGSPVWKISKGANHVYLGGSIHLLAAADFPLPPALSTAYAQSARLVLETDVGRLQSPATAAVMMNALSYPVGSGIRQRVSAETYAALERYFTSRGVPMAQVEGFKPGMISTMMTIIELGRLGLAGPGVDAHFEQRATRDGKALGQLESLERQIEFLAGMGIGREDEFLRYALDETANLPTLWPAVRDAWRSGDMARMEALGVAPLRRDFPRIHHALLVERNRAWMPQIEAMLNSPEIEFVLVGALHLAGRDGLLEQLAARGYAIEQLR